MSSSQTRLRKPLHPISADEFDSAGIMLEGNGRRMAETWSKAYGVAPQGVMDVLGHGLKGPVEASLSMDQPGEFDGSLTLDSGATASFRLRPSDKAVDVHYIDSSKGPKSPEHIQMMANLTTLARSLGAESMLVNSNTADAGASLAQMGAEPTADSKADLVSAMNKHLRQASGIPVDVRQSLSKTLDAGEAGAFGRLYDQAKEAGVAAKVFDVNGVGNQSWQGTIDLTNLAQIARVDTALAGAKAFDQPTPDVEPMAGPTPPKLSM